MLDQAQQSYQRLRSIYAEATRPVVFWIGAGLSKPAGLPDWQGLRLKLEEEADRKVETYSERDKSAELRKLYSIKQETNNWRAFERLRSLMGRASFQASIREILSAADSTVHPTSYQSLWSLDVSGFVTLNLDRFCAKSAPTALSARILEFNGQDSANYLYNIGGRRPFIANMHGILDDSSSWVLTLSDLAKLRTSPGYQAFAIKLFTTFSVVFIGISADDVAAGGLLEEIATGGISTTQHFWLTDRRDLLTDQWAEGAGIQVIRYRAETDAEHGETIRVLVRDFSGFRSVDRPARPVTGENIPAVDEIPHPSELAREPPESIRKLLNGRAVAMLSGTTSIADYQAFHQMYERCIHNAWFVSTNPPENEFFGNQIRRRVGGGAFGDVYEAVDPQGTRIAIKVLKRELSNLAGFLESFRRGVESMRILAGKNIDGMAKFVNAYEMPPCVIMEYIDGVDLTDLVKDPNFDVWRDGLTIAIEISRIVLSGHLLTERVLHRDLRPSNIMVEGYYTGLCSSRVKVLDFDLSWHRGAIGDSILPGTTIAGYLAPEQISELPSASRRSALVDSYGLGMTMFYIFARREPPPYGRTGHEWDAVTRVAFRARGDLAWRSLPKRILRLIEGCTEFHQRDRLGIGHVFQELEDLRDAQSTSAQITRTDLWAEEVAARAFPHDDYEWSEDKQAALFSLRTGLVMSLSGRQKTGDVEFSIARLATGTEHRAGMDRFWPQVMANVLAILRSGGWSTADQEDDVRRSIRINASIGIDHLRGGLDNIVKCLQKARDEIARVD